MARSTGLTLTNTGRLAQTLASAASHFQKSFGILFNITGLTHAQCQSGGSSTYGSVLFFFYLLMLHFFVDVQVHNLHFALFSTFICTACSFSTLRVCA